MDTSERKTSTETFLEVINKRNGASCYIGCDKTQNRDFAFGDLKKGLSYAA